MEASVNEELNRAVECARIDLENPNYYGENPAADLRPAGERTSRPLHLFTASAGSGKTWRLAFEYISLLLKDARLPSEADARDSQLDNYRHILAITFTNKATAEMKDRILANLALLSNAETTDENEKNERETYLQQLSHRLSVSPSVVAGRAKLVYFNLLHDYSHFHIQTIDSFFQSVLRNLAQELGIGSYWEVELDSEAVLKEAAHRLLNRVKDDGKLRQWITGYVKDRMDENKNWNVEGELVSFGSNLFSEALVTNDQMDQFLTDDPENPTLRKRISTIKQALLEARKMAKEEVQMAAERFTAYCSANNIAPEQFSRKIVHNYAQKLADGLLDDPNETVKKFLGATTPDEMAQKAFLKKFQAENLPHAATLQNLLAEAVRALSQNQGRIIVFNQVIKNINQIGLLADIKNEVGALQEEQNMFMLAYAQPLLHKFISNEDAPFVFERIGESLRYMMIDEFQDTSKVQFQNFRPLIQNCCAENYGSLIVGDAKQAIYRFRNGDWTLIESLRSQAADKGEPRADLHMPTPIQGHDMQFNYRSSQNVVNFNNAVFRTNFESGAYPIAFGESVVSLLEKGKKDGNTEYLNQVYSTSFQFPRKKSQGYVKVKFHQKSTDDKDAEQPWALAAMLAEVQRLNKAGVAYSDITILSRFNKDIPVIAAYLKEKGVPVVSDLAFLLRASIKVRLIVDALRYVDAYLTSPAATVKDQLFKKELMCDYLRYLHQEDAENIDFTEEKAEVEEWCRKLRGDTDLDDNETDGTDTLPALPVYDLVEEIYRMIFAGEPTDEYVQAFFDHLRDFLSRRVASVKDVLKHWDDRLSAVSIPADPKKANGVRMLSIHKSKGLEGHTVILANCGWSATTDRTSSFWCSGIGKFGDGMESFEIPVVPIDFGASLEKTAFAPEYWEEMAQLHAENVNLLYVALTRAKHNLIVIDEYTISKTKEEEDEGYGKFQTAQMGRLLFEIFAPADLQNDPVALDLGDEEKSRALTEGDQCYQIGEIVPSELPSTDSADEKAKNELEMVTGSDTFPIKGRFRQSVAANAFVVHGELASNDNADFGLHMHDLLSFIDHMANVEQPEPEIRKAVRRLLLEGVLNADDEAEYVRLAARYFTRLPQEYREAWFGASKKVYNESNIILYGEWTSKRLEEKRPDRLVFDADTNIFTVVDYKTGRPKQSHVEQVQNYMRLVHQLCPTAQVEGYLWHLNSNKVSEVLLQE